MSEAKSKKSEDQAKAKLAKRLFDAIVAKDEEGLAACFEAGADPNAVIPQEDWRDEWELPRALHYALRRGWDEGVFALLAAGADPSSKTAGPKGGTEALLWAGCAATSRALIEAGADPSVRGREGMSVAARLAWHLKKPDALSFFTLCRERGQDLEQRDDEGRSLLFHAASKFNLDSVEALLELGCDPNSKNNKGESVLKEPACSRSRDRVLWSRGKKVTRALIFAGADPNARDHEGRAPDYALAAYCGAAMAQDWREVVKGALEEKERREIKAQMRRGARGMGPKRI